MRKTQAHWPVDADRVGNFLRQDLDVIPPKGEEQKSLNLQKKERKKEMDTDWKLRQKGYCYMGAPGIRPALKDTLRQK